MQVKGCPVQVFPFCNGPGRNFLDVMSRFHNYSVNNTMLISIQNPGARHLLEAVEKVCPITIHYKSPHEDRVLGEAYGYYDLSDNTITVNRDLSNDQKAKTLIHEFAHSVLHKGALAEVKDRSTKEIEAESTAYVVCRHFGLDTSDYSSRMKSL